MQNVLKAFNRNLLRSKANYLICLHSYMIRNPENFGQCLNHNQILRLFGSMSQNTIQQIQKEYRAVHSLLVHSGLSQSCNVNQKSRLHTSSTKANNNNKNVSSSSSNSTSNNDSNKKKNDEKLHAFKLKLMGFTTIIYMILLYMYYLMSNRTVDGEESTRFISWNEFVHQMLAKGEVKEINVNPELEIVTIVLHDGAIIKGKRSNYRTYQMRMPNPMEVEEKVRQAEINLGINPEFGVPVIYDRPAAFQYLIVISVVMGLVSYFILKTFPFKVKMPANMFSNMTRAKFTLVDPLTGVGKGVKFSDVAGLYEAKTEIMEFVDFLKSPDRYKALGAKIPKGALLLGPPGCGKTLLAKAVATEANVPFLSMNGSEFIEMIGGLGAARVRNLFKEGKKRAPSIIYIDEIDAIGRKRAESNFDRANSESEQTLNQLLTEMDGMVSSQDVIVLASTNRADILDKALLRPGRFDRHIFIDLPTLIERREIFEVHLKNLTLEHKITDYSSRLAFLTPGFSGADIANVCNEAALHAARFSKKKIDDDDLLYAVDRLIAGTEKRNNTIAPTEKRVVAFHEAGHALVAWLLEHTDALLKITIIPRTNRALGFSQFTPPDQKLFTKEQLFERMCVLLGGRVAESLTFNKITTGAQNDLEKVTKMAYAQVQQYGMDEVIGPLSYHPEQTNTTTRKPYSKQMANLMDQETRRIITQAYKKTEQLLIEHKDKLHLLSETLLKKETLTYEEVEKLIGPPPFGKKRLEDPSIFETSTPPPKTPETPPDQPIPA